MSDIATLPAASQIPPPERLAALVARYAPGEAETVRTAWSRAATVYGQQRLGSGEPALAHAVEVALLLDAMRMDHETVSAALLAHVPDFAPDSMEWLRLHCGAAVAQLVEGLGRMAQIQALSGAPRAAEDQHAQLEALRKMLLAMVQDIRVVLIKLADQVQTLRFVVGAADEVLRRQTARETLDLFAPLANRLGAWQFKWELEDLSLRILEPEIYQRIARLLDEKRGQRERYIGDVIALLRREMQQAGINAEVSGRPKHIYSIYKKMRRKDVDFTELYDVRAVRVLVGDVKDCYAALGVVHNLWTPIPREFDDYIAKPKANNYRSLHTAVIGPEGKALEVQIRTHDMHRESELGVAAHWRYKEGGRGDARFDDRIAWLRQLLAWKDEVPDAGELAQRFKTGLFEDTIYVLTPQGRVVALPKDATPVDFAYHVHTDLGHRCRGAKVDGVMVPLNSALHNGERVEISAAKQGGPSRDWLNPELGYLKSHRARAKVRQWFNSQQLEEALAQGRTIVERELQRAGMTAFGLDRLAALLHFAKPDELLAAAGRGEITPRQIQDALRAESVPAERPSGMPLVRKAGAAPASGGVLVVGVDKLMTVLAKCCKPAPPDSIIGFVTRGRGVTVHRRSCSNVAHLPQERLISADWGTAAERRFSVDIEVEAHDRQGLLRDISEVLSREKINVTSANTQSRGDIARMSFTLEVGDVTQLGHVLTLLGEVQGVLGARRK
ncbi:MAG: bifunctional (p)ppGpp synthetase/guanosine-3',5'-bis(diphosphate) 3'-pyrophosphohydrolase [Pseudomonadota bacterium]